MSDQSVICDICRERFARPFTLKRHMEAQHGAKQEHPCTQCGLIATTKANLDFHVLSVHDGQKHHVCDQCGKAFSKANHLKRHRETHDTANIKVCDQCGKDWPTANFVRHVLNCGGKLEILPDSDSDSDIESNLPSSSAIQHSGGKMQKRMIKSNQRFKSVKKLKIIHKPQLTENVINSKNSTKDSTICKDKDDADLPASDSNVPLSSDIQRSKGRLQSKESNYDATITENSQIEPTVSRKSDKKQRSKQKRVMQKKSIKRLSDMKSVNYKGLANISDSHHSAKGNCQLMTRKSLSKSKNDNSLAIQNNLVEQNVRHSTSSLMDNTGKANKIVPAKENRHKTSIKSVCHEQKENNDSRKEKRLPKQLTTVAKNVPDLPSSSSSPIVRPRRIINKKHFTVGFLVTPDHIWDKTMIGEIQEQVKQKTEIINVVDVVNSTCGNAVFAGAVIKKGEAVCYYAGDLLKAKEGKARAKTYADDEAYIYYFQKGRLCIDGTLKTGKGNYINHCMCGRRQNLEMRLLHLVGNSKIDMVFIASRDINKGDELRFDYGDRNKDSISREPWLQNCCPT